MFFWQNIFITPYEALVYSMLDAPLTAGFLLRSSWLCLILCIEKGCSSFYRVSSIQNRVSCPLWLNVNANDIFISDSGLPGLGSMF